MRCSAAEAIALFRTMPAMASEDAYRTRPSEATRSAESPPQDGSGTAERVAYVRQWNEKFERAMRLTRKEVAQLVPKSDGFSFAYLKELFVSSMVRWMVAREAGTMGAIVEEQLAVLREHMRSEADATNRRARIDGMLTQFGPARA
jgi:hypothetical protein